MLPLIQDAPLTGVQDEGDLVKLGLFKVLTAEAEGRPEGGLMDGNHYGGRPLTVL